MPLKSSTQSQTVSGTGVLQNLFNALTGGLKCHKKCDDGTCRSKYQLCPGEYCAEGLMTCDNGKGCFDPLAQCDGHNQCEDKTDEKDCGEICTVIETYCRTEGVCVVHGEPCPSKSCPIARPRRCANRKQCYAQKQRCDGFANCFDISDEASCPKKHVSIKRSPTTPTASSTPKTTQKEQSGLVAQILSTSTPKGNAQARDTPEPLLIGIIVSSLVLVVLVVALICCCCAKKKKRPHCENKKKLNERSVISINLDSQGVTNRSVVPPGVPSQAPCVTSLSGIPHGVTPLNGALEFTGIGFHARAMRTPSAPTVDQDGFYIIPPGMDGLDTARSRASVASNIGTTQPALMRTQVRLPGATGGGPGGVRSSGRPRQAGKSPAAGCPSAPPSYDEVMAAPTPYPILSQNVTLNINQ